MSLAKKGKPCNFIKTKFKAGDKRIVGKNNHNWNGGQYFHSLGYVVKRIAINKYKLEHRLIIEKYLGRPLKSSEDVHHINGIKTDNRIKNLMAFNGRSSHRRYECGNKEVFAHEIIFDGRSA